jgi:hypothetical protein
MMRRLLKTLLVGIAGLVVGWLLPASGHASIISW